MIYAIGMYGFVQYRDAQEQFNAQGRGKESHGQWVWQTLDEALQAAAEVNERNLKARPGNPAKLPHRATWVVLGVDADWERDTTIADAKCPFPTANELLFERPFRQLQQTLPLDIQHVVNPDKD